MRLSALFVATALAAAAAHDANATAVTGPPIGPGLMIPGYGPGFALEGLLLPAVSPTPLNPEVILGFNPQPDPPGSPPTFLSLTNPMMPMLINGDPSRDYQFVMSFLHLFPPGPCDTALPMPDSRGMTGFSCNGNVGGVPDNVDVTLRFFGPGGVTVFDDFNPQPEPPGVPVGANVVFGGLDAGVAFSIAVNGQDLAFRTVPEPSAMLLFGAGLVSLSVVRRRT